MVSRVDWVLFCQSKYSSNIAGFLTAMEYVVLVSRITPRRVIWADDGRADTMDPDRINSFSNV
jgi:hypothetical protein